MDNQQRDKFYNIYSHYGQTLLPTLVYVTIDLVCTFIIVWCFSCLWSYGCTDVHIVCILDIVIKKNFDRRRNTSIHAVFYDSIHYHN